MSKSKIGWTTQEENVIRQMKESQNIMSWKNIAKSINALFDNRRTAKQCRERYMNFTKFGQEISANSVWTVDQDILLLQCFCKYSSKWSQMSTQFPDRSQNNLKNRFYGIIRKVYRKLYKVEVLIRQGHKKLIKIETLMNILSVSGKIQALNNTNNQKLVQFGLLVFSVREQIFKMISSEDGHQQPQKLQQITKNVYSFLLFVRTEKQIMDIVNKKKRFQKQIESKDKNIERKQNQQEYQCIQSLIYGQTQAYQQMASQIVKVELKQINSLQVQKNRELGRCNLEEQFCGLLQIKYNRQDYLPFFV